MVRADTTDVAFRLFLSIGELWDGLQRAGIDPGARGLHLTKEYLGGYTRYSAGPAARSRLVVEWNESSRHLRVVRNDAWQGFEALVCATVSHIRSEARCRGLADVVERRFVGACNEPAQPSRRTVVANAGVAPVPARARA